MDNQQIDIEYLEDGWTRKTVTYADGQKVSMLYLDEEIEFMIEDWKKWMDQHHIKLRGDPVDDRTDAIPLGRCLSRAKVEAQMHGNARKASHSHIQEHEQD